MENLVEWMAGETEVLGENLPLRHFVHHKSHLTRPGIEYWIDYILTDAEIIIPLASETEYF
jgi:hypothetical protein